jgi:microsomal dipeptidase-like Zn-dependent dipeptidase
MKKLQFIFFIYLFVSAHLSNAQTDVTGTWQSADGWKAEFVQDGTKVYAILNVYNFKHMIIGTISGNQIRGIISRYDLNNNCLTAMDGTWTLNGNNSMQLTWKDLDGRCDLSLNQTGVDAPLTRVTRPSELPMNGFGGNFFDTNSDVTGSWGDGDFIEIARLVYFINNNSGFKHYFTGSRVGNQITGTQTRINRSNNCKTEMDLTFTITNANSMQYRGVAKDSRCDLTAGWSETSTIIRRGTNGTVAPAVQAGTYTLTNKNSNLCLAVRGATQNNGEETTQWACDGNADKNWKIIDAGGGYYKLQNSNSNHFLAVGAGSRDHGGRVVQYVDQGQQDILWRLVDIGGGYYKVQNKNSGLVLAVGAGSRNQGADVVQWGDAGQEDIKWKLDRVLNLVDIGGYTPFRSTVATVYPNPNFGGTSNGIRAVGRNTLSQLGISSIGSIKVAWGYKAIVTSGVSRQITNPTTGRVTVISSEQQMEIVGDREGDMPVGITSIEIVAYTPLNGWVDMHTHPMSHLGWGGKLFHGAPDVGILVPAKDNCQQYQRANNINEALCSCKGTHGGVGFLDNTCGDDIRKALLRVTESKLANGTVQSQHHEEGARGYPDFRFWPAHNDMTHQQMWIDWIKRNYDNGQRTMVALAVNNVTYAAGFSGPGDRNPDDVSSANIQIEEMKRLVARHNGSAGSVDNWMEIATSAADFRRIVNANKMAIVLGVEVDNIGNFHQNPRVTSNITTEGTQIVRAEIERLRIQGVRYIFPIHLVDNKFGGTAIYEPNFDFSNYHQNNRFLSPVCATAADSITKPFKLFEWFLGLAGAKFNVDIARRPPPLPVCTQGLGHKNSVGLTPMGEFAVLEMMRKGMIIDIDHMSDNALNSILNLGERNNYPLNSGHSGVREGGEASERGLKISQYQRLSALGGIAGLGTDDATAENFISGFNKLKTIMSFKGVAVGTDVNGFAKLPQRPGFIGVTYDASFPISRTGNRTWDYNNEGVAHYGLMSDFFKDVRGIGSNGLQAITHLNRSTEYFAQMWEKCERQRTTIR